jgi:D-lyxose ketol-isomerase
MIIEDEKEQAKIHIDLNVNPGASIALLPQVKPCFQAAPTKKFRNSR